MEHVEKPEDEVEQTSVVLIVLPALLISLVLIFGIVGRMIYKRWRKRLTRIVYNQPNYRAVNNLSYSIVNRSISKPMKYDCLESNKSDDETEDGAVTPTRKTHVHKRGSKAYILSKKNRTSSPGKVKRVVKRKQVRRVAQMRSEEKNNESDDEMVLYSNIGIHSKSTVPSEGFKSIQQDCSVTPDDPAATEKNNIEVPHHFNQTGNAYFDGGDVKRIIITDADAKAQDYEYDSLDRVTPKTADIKLIHSSTNWQQNLLPVDSLSHTKLSTDVIPAIENLSDDEPVYATVNKFVLKSYSHDNEHADSGSSDEPKHKLQIFENALSDGGQEKPNPPHDLFVVDKTSSAPIANATTGTDERSPERSRKQIRLGKPDQTKTNSPRKQKRKVVVVKRKTVPEMKTDIAES